MDVKSAVFALVSIREMHLKEIAEKLPYSRIAIYKAAAVLVDGGLVEKRREGKGVMLCVAKGYRAQKLREIYLKSLSYGVDPSFIMSDAALKIWKVSGDPKSLDDLAVATNMSYNWVRKIAGALIRGGILEYRRRKPAVIVRTTHELNQLLESYFFEEKGAAAYIPGIAPFEYYTKKPEEVERMLYEKLDEGISVRDTGFIARGKKLKVVESVRGPSTPEMSFIAAIETPEGIEDLCIRMIESGQIDYGKLLDIAKERGTVNQVGCYLDVLNSVKEMVPDTAVRHFLESVSKKRKAFLKALKKYGKEGWEKPFEEKWNVDLYLEIGAIRHGIGGGFKGAVG